MPGKYYSELQVGMSIEHRLRRTLTEADNVLFCSMTMNTQPLHLDEEFARDTVFGQRIMNGIFTLGLVVGMTVPELTEGTIVANLGYEQINHPNPAYPGDTVRVSTHVLEMRESKSKQNRGIVKLKHTAYKQDDTVICEVIRTVMFLIHAEENA